ncbi:hypothetical protein [Spongorhabdus nitratireducens]
MDMTDIPDSVIKRPISCSGCNTTGLRHQLPFTGQQDKPPRRTLGSDEELLTIFPDDPDQPPCSFPVKITICC